MKKLWNDFWFEYIYPSYPMTYGGQYKVKRKFKKQKLFNIIIGLLMVIILFIVCR
jgi:hypothetical protein